MTNQNFAKTAGFRSAGHKYVNFGDVLVWLIWILLVNVLFSTPADILASNSNMLDLVHVINNFYPTFLYPFMDSLIDTEVATTKS